LKSSIIRLEKDGIEITTVFIDFKRVKWFNEEGSFPFIHLISQGYKVVSDLPVRTCIDNLHGIRDKLCAREKIENRDLMAIIRELEQYIGLDEY